MQIWWNEIQVQGHNTSLAAPCDLHFFSSLLFFEFIFDPKIFIILIHFTFIVFIAHSWKGKWIHAQRNCMMGILLCKQTCRRILCVSARTKPVSSVGQRKYFSSPVSMCVALHNRNCSICELPFLVQQQQQQSINIKIYEWKLVCFLGQII